METGGKCLKVGIRNAGSGQRGAGGMPPSSSFSCFFRLINSFLAPILGPVLGPVGSRSGSHFGYNFWDPKLNPKFEPKGLTVCGQNKFLVAVSGQRSAPEDFARRRRTMPFCGEVVRRWIEVKRTHN